jgi:hypothetical protein
MKAVLYRQPDQFGTFSGVKWHHMRFLQGTGLVGGGCGDEKDVWFILAEDAQQLRFAYAATTVENKQFCPTRAVVLVEERQLFFSVYKHEFAPFSYS